MFLQKTPPFLIVTTIMNAKEKVVIGFSEEEVSRLSTYSRDNFAHSWLSDKSLSFCQTTGVFWLIYEEGQGMFCFLCKKLNTENKKNKSKAYNATPSVRFKKSAI